MSLDFSLSRIQETCVFDANITHNLAEMATEAGIYEALWRPLENNFTKAEDIIDILEKGLALLKEKPKHFKQFDAENGWGTYENFVPFVESVLAGCKEYPDASILISK
jgi:hypothetical protein